MADEASVINGATIARSMLQRYHEKQDYEVTVPLEIIEQIKQQRRLWNFMFLVIASVSMLVGEVQSVPSRASERPSPSVSTEVLARIR